ncbi:hypothetical protein KA531_04000 [Candidatus Saccharibacteria bacterium]|nr:hypothetical protein [Candidatus Saccharibacteria bacterium]
MTETRSSTPERTRGESYESIELRSSKEGFLEDLGRVPADIDPNIVWKMAELVFEKSIDSLGRGSDAYMEQLMNGWLFDVLERFIAVKALDRTARDLFVDRLEDISLDQKTTIKAMLDVVYRDQDLIIPPLDPMEHPDPKNPRLVRATRSNQLTDSPESGEYLRKGLKYQAKIQYISQAGELKTANYQLDLGDMLESLNSAPDGVDMDVLLVQLIKDDIAKKIDSLKFGAGYGDVDRDELKDKVYQMIIVDAENNTGSREDLKTILDNIKAYVDSSSSLDYLEDYRFAIDTDDRFNEFVELLNPDKALAIYQNPDFDSQPKVTQLLVLSVLRTYYNVWEGKRGLTKSGKRKVAWSEKVSIMIRDIEDKYSAIIDETGTALTGDPAVDNPNQANRNQLVLEISGLEQWLRNEARELSPHAFINTFMGTEKGQRRSMYASVAVNALVGAAFFSPLSGAISLGAGLAGIAVMRTEGGRKIVEKVLGNKFFKRLSGAKPGFENQAEGFEPKESSKLKKYAAAALLAAIATGSVLASPVNTITFGMAISRATRVGISGAFGWAQGEATRDLELMRAMSMDRDQANLESIDTDALVKALEDQDMKAYANILKLPDKKNPFKRALLLTALSFTASNLGHIASNTFIQNRGGQTVYGKWNESRSHGSHTPDMVNPTDQATGRSFASSSSTNASDHARHTGQTGSNQAADHQDIGSKSFGEITRGSDYLDIVDRGDGVIACYQDAIRDSLADQLSKMPTADADQLVARLADRAYHIADAKGRFDGMIRWDDAYRSPLIHPGETVTLYGVDLNQAIQESGVDFPVSLVDLDDLATDAQARIYQLQSENTALRKQLADLTESTNGSGNANQDSIVHTTTSRAGSTEHQATTSTIQIDPVESMTTSPNTTTTVIEQSESTTTTQTPQDSVDTRGSITTNSSAEANSGSTTTTGLGSDRWIDSYSHTSYNSQVVDQVHSYAENNQLFNGNLLEVPQSRYISVRIYKTNSFEQNIFAALMGQEGFQDIGPERTSKFANLLASILRATPNMADQFDATESYIGGGSNIYLKVDEINALTREVAKNI